MNMVSYTCTRCKLRDEAKDVDVIKMAKDSLTGADEVEAEYIVCRDCKRWIEKFIQGQIRLVVE